MTGTVYNPDMGYPCAKFPPIIALLMIAVTGCGVEATPEMTPTVAPAQPISTPVVATPTSTQLPGATATVPADDCLNDAIFVEDVTIPDFSLVEPGESLDKRWTVQNTGTCDWGPGYKLMRLGTDDFTGPSELALFPARAGSSAELRVELSAPDEPGEHISRWQAFSANGAPFGQEIYLLIVIPTPTPVPTATSNSL